MFSMQNAKNVSGCRIDDEGEVFGVVLPRMKVPKSEDDYEKEKHCHAIEISNDVSTPSERDIQSGPTQPK